MNAMKKEYQNIVDKYIKLFCEKHDLFFDSWVGENESSHITACFTNDIILNVDDIRLDIDMNIPVGVIEEWTNVSSINFLTFCRISK